MLCPAGFDFPTTKKHQESCIFLDSVAVCGRFWNVFEQIYVWWYVMCMCVIFYLLQVFAAVVPGYNWVSTLKDVGHHSIATIPTWHDVLSDHLRHHGGSKDLKVGASINSSITKHFRYLKWRVSETWNKVVLGVGFPFNKPYKAL